jgi:hypothetical protein
MATRTPTPAWPRSPRRSPRNSPRAPQRQVPALTCVATYALAGRQLSTRRCCSPSWRRSPWRSPGSSASPHAGSPGVPSPYSSLTNEVRYQRCGAGRHLEGSAGRRRRDKLNGWAARAATGAAQRGPRSPGSGHLEPGRPTRRTPVRAKSDLDGKSRDESLEREPGTRKTPAGSTTAVQR